MTYGFSIKLKKGVLSRTKVRAELPLRLLYNALFAFRLLADIHPALGSGGCFQLLQGQLDGGVIVARRKDIIPLLRSYSVMAQTRAGRPVAPSMRG